MSKRDGNLAPRDSEADFHHDMIPNSDSPLFFALYSSGAHFVITPSRLATAGTKYFFDELFLISNSIKVKFLCECCF